MKPPEPVGVVTGNFAKWRERCVARQIEARGIKDGRVLSAMRAVPRELFVPRDERELAYADRPLPIGAGQTISQPYIVAVMIEALGLNGGEKVLEIGAGSGYAAAVLARIAAQVFAVERIAELADLARGNLTAAQAGNVAVRCSDGSLGWREKAPFDAILVSAGAPTVPEALKAQLVIGGRLVVPTGEVPTEQKLLRVTRTSVNQFETEDLGAVRFVPLVGREGWPEVAG